MSRKIKGSEKKKLQDIHNIPEMSKINISRKKQKKIHNKYMLIQSVPKSYYKHVCVSLDIHIHKYIHPL